MLLKNQIPKKLKIDDLNVAFTTEKVDYFRTSKGVEYIDEEKGQYAWIVSYKKPINYEHSVNKTTS